MKKEVEENLTFFYDKHYNTVEGAILLEEWLKELISTMHAKIMIQEVVGQAGEEKVKDMEIVEAIHRLKTFACYRVDNEDEYLEEGSSLAYE